VRFCCLLEEKGERVDGQERRRTLLPLRGCPDGPVSLVSIREDINGIVEKHTTEMSSYNILALHSSLSYQYLVVFEARK
jgi:hypothetical protein